MTQNFKNYPKLGVLLFGIALMLVNCQLDDEFHQPEQHNTENTEPLYTVTRVSKKEINQNQVVSGVIERIKRQAIAPANGNLNRLITNATFNVVIDDENAKYLEKSDGSYHSYTFKVVDDDETSKKNLVLSVKEDGTYKEILVSYYLTEDDLQAYQLTGKIDFDINVTYDVINDDTFSIDIYSRELAPTTDYSDCYEFVYDGKKCSYNMHTWEQAQNGECCVTNGECSGTEATQGNLIGLNIDQSCINSGYTSDVPDDSGPGPHDSSNDGSGGNGGTGDDNDDYDPTDPDVHGNGAEGDDDPLFAPDFDEEEEEDPDPCADLKQLSNIDDQNINSEIQFLKDKLTNGTETEWGIRMKREQNQNGTHTQTNIQVEGGSNGVNLIKGWNWIGGAHLHTVNGYEMFSWSDVYDLAGFHTSSSADNQQFVVTILVTHNPSYANNPTTNQYNVYAIKADNPNILINKANSFWNSSYFSRFPEEKRMEEILKWQQDKFKENKNNLEKYFLEFHRDYGISLYKANNDLSNWNKLTLNGTVVEEIPCD